MESIEDIKHTLYINLESRPDRKKIVEKELSKLNISFERFNAICLQNGALGCSMSHLKCLELAKKNNWDHVLIVEDDIKFLNSTLFIRQINKFFKNQKNWDVLLIAGNNMPPYCVLDDYCVKVTRCQTTTGYLVKQHYYDTLIDNIRIGIANLIREPHNHVLYAIDKYWFALQEKDLWYLITPLTVTQEEGYSDIEKRMTNYTNVMTDLDKKWLIERQKKFSINAFRLPSTIKKPSTSLDMNL